MLGSVLPAAGHKGYGLAVVDEVLAGVLTGAVLSPVMPRAYLEEDVQRSTVGVQAISSWRST